MFSQRYGIPRKEARPRGHPDRPARRPQEDPHASQALPVFRTAPFDRSRAGRRPRCRPAPEVLEGCLAPAILTVDGPADDTATDTALTLREAVALVDGPLGRSLTAAE
jgi:hypothetical protein